MSISKHQIAAYYFGDPGSIAAKILFIKRAARLAVYKQYLMEVQEFGNVWHGITGLIHEEQLAIATGIGPSVVGDAA
jgi:hypothetical protein